MSARYVVCYTSALREGVHYYCHCDTKREAIATARKISTRDQGASKGDTAIVLRVECEIVTP